MIPSQYQTHLNTSAVPSIMPSVIRQRQGLNLMVTNANVTTIVSISCITTDRDPLNVGFYGANPGGAATNSVLSETNTNARMTDL